MKKVILLGAVLASLSVGAGAALEPAEAGRQARDDLDALMEQQRQDKEAAKDAAKKAATPLPSGEPDGTASGPPRRGRKPASVEDRIPTICTGCGTK